MKKLIMITLLVLMTSLSFGADKIIASSNEVPYELRGVWYVVVSSPNSGLVNGQPLYSVTRKLISTKYGSLEVAKVNTHQVDNDLAYGIFTEDFSKKLLLTNEGGHLILYYLVNDNLIFKALIEIRQ